MKKVSLAWNPGVRLLSDLRSDLRSPLFTCTVQYI
jgi:hypothetical protein